MKIAIEAQRIFRSNKHGMDFCCARNHPAVAATRPRERVLHPREPGRRPLPQRECEFPYRRDQLPHLSALGAGRTAARRAQKSAPDLLHCTSNTAPVRCSAPLVLTLHDIIFLEKRAAQNRSMYQNLGWHYRRLVVPRILPHCRKVITVSRFEQQRIQQALQLPEEVLTTIHNGVSPHFRPVADPGAVTRKYLPEDRFLFFLGNTDPKKNTPRTLRGYARYRELSQHPLPLLVADLKPEAADALLREHGIEGIRPALRLPGYIPNTDLPAIYSGGRNIPVHFTAGEFRHTDPRGDGLRNSGGHFEHVGDPRDCRRRRHLGRSARRRGDRGPVATARNRPAVPRRSSGLRPRACPAIHLGGDGPQATRPLPQRRSAINAYREAGNHTPNRRKAHPLCSSKTRQEKESYKTNAETIKSTELGSVLLSILPFRRTHPFPLSFLLLFRDGKGLVPTGVRAARTISSVPDFPDFGFPVHRYTNPYC